ncbi:RNA polymerase sigma-70 factor [Sunxiuqinia sp. sy24]|uniref:RNA polymerase sigma-70 factor n=1 Tax=Sunxiuqinia sp. sy24 TaxID=3461495 RepID=UPI004045A105
MGQDKYISLPEKELIAKLNRGDVKTFNLFFRSYYKPLFFYALRITQEQEASKDIIQETFSQFWQERKNVPIRYSLAAYLYRMVRNKSLNYIQKQKRQALGNTRYAYMLLQSSDSTNNLDHKEILYLIDQQVSLFPPRQKQVFLLSRQQGLSHKEIAEQLNLSTKTVETFIFRSLKRLKVGLKQFL